MNKDRKFFQENLRKNVDIKRHIASNFHTQVVKQLKEQVQSFDRNVLEEVRENEK